MATSDFTSKNDNNMEEYFWNQHKKCKPKSHGLENLYARTFFIENILYITFFCQRMFLNNTNYNVAVFTSDMFWILKMVLI